VGQRMDVEYQLALLLIDHIVGDFWDFELIIDWYNYPLGKFMFDVGHELLVVPDETSPEVTDDVALAVIPAKIDIGKTLQNHDGSIFGPIPETVFLNKIEAQPFVGTGIDFEDAMYGYDDIFLMDGHPLFMGDTDQICAKDSTLLTRIVCQYKPPDQLDPVPEPQDGQISRTPKKTGWKEYWPDSAKMFETELEVGYENENFHSSRITGRYAFIYEGTLNPLHLLYHWDDMIPLPDGGFRIFNNSYDYGVYRNDLPQDYIIHDYFYPSSYQITIDGWAIDPADPNTSYHYVVFWPKRPEEDPQPVPGIIPGLTGAIIGLLLAVGGTALSAVFGTREDDDSLEKVKKRDRMIDKIKRGGV
jgi:hypothetical protein